MTNHVLHIAAIDAWTAASTADPAVYVDASLDAEGFIHCSTPAQVLIPANERFAGRSDLVLLVIDTEQVPSETIFEDCYETGQEFPHIYGPIPTAAVLQVVPFPSMPDGSFELPTAVRDSDT